MSTDEIDRLQRFRQTGQWINSKEKFQEVTKVDNAWMQQYDPYFQFPVFTKTLPSRPKQKKYIRPLIYIWLRQKNLNKSTELALY